VISFLGWPVESRLWRDWAC